MSSPLNRRRFLKTSALAAGAGTLAFRFEEGNLQAHAAGAAPAPTPADAASFPRGQLGKLSVTRLICGGNLISGFGHSRDLIYVSPLLKKWFTDEKIFETLQTCEAHGVNTMILRVDKHILRIVREYRGRGGKLQWIAQCAIKENDHSTIQMAIDRGAVGAFVHGNVSDSMVAAGKVDELGKAVDMMKRNGLVSGIAGHAIAVHQAVERAGIKPDFYMKTFNSKQYWSAGPQPRRDSVWEETPEETRQFMAGVDRPWIAYKVLGAGAIHPKEGFAYAFENGADFIVVGMFDFQVAEDVELARAAIAKARDRQRKWRG